MAITSGTMRNLFVGKRGVFFDADGVEYDAQIVQFLDQPVSIPDALIDPFRKFAAFVGKQFDKLFASRAGEAQNSLGADLSSGKAPSSNGSALNGSMLLMGGGIGLAALGSALAFIVKALQDVSVWKVLIILLCIILIFGGPGVIIALYTLFRRNLAR